MTVPLEKAMRNCTRTFHQGTNKIKYTYGRTCKIQQLR